MTATVYGPSLQVPNIGEPDCPSVRSAAVVIASCGIAAGDLGERDGLGVKRAGLRRPVVLLLEVKPPRALFPNVLSLHENYKWPQEVAVCLERNYYL